MPRLPRNFGPYCLLIAMIAMLGVVLVYPVLLTVRGSVAADAGAGRGFTLVHFRLIFSDPTLVAGLVNATLVALATTALCLLVALPLAIFAATYRYPLKGTFNALILVPLIIPPFVGALGMQAIMGRAGALNAL